MAKKQSLDTKYIAERITDLRMEHKVSEYQLSLDLGFSKGYIQAISSGNILPSLGALYKICEYFDITPEQFFSGNNSDSKLLNDLLDALREMSPEEQYTLYHFLKGGKLSELKDPMDFNQESPEELPPESDI